MQCFGFQLRSNLQTKKRGLRVTEQECDAVRTVETHRSDQTEGERGKRELISSSHTVWGQKFWVESVEGEIEFKVYSYKREPKEELKTIQRAPDFAGKEVEAEESVFLFSYG